MMSLGYDAQRGLLTCKAPTAFWDKIPFVDSDQIISQANDVPVLKLPVDPIEGGCECR